MELRTLARAHILAKDAANEAMAAQPGRGEPRERPAARLKRLAYMMRKRRQARKFRDAADALLGLD